MGAVKDRGDFSRGRNFQLQVPEGYPIQTIRRGVGLLCVAPGLKKAGLRFEQILAVQNGGQGSAEEK